METTHTDRGKFAALNGYLFIIVFLLSFALGARGKYPTPWSDPQSIQAFYSANQGASVTGAILQSIAGLALVAFGATVSARLARFSFGKVQSRMTLAGAILAGGFMLLGALGSWLVSRPEVLGDISTLRLAQDFTFLSGGFAHVISLALLVGPLSMIALVTGFMPRWVGVFGLLIALVALLGVLGLASEPLNLFLPIARFATFVWVGIVATLLLTEKAPAAQPK